MKDAFATPLPTPEMIRLTFITGAGKLGRQKYDENAARCVTSVSHIFISNQKDGIVLFEVYNVKIYSLKSIYIYIYIHAK